MPEPTNPGIETASLPAVIYCLERDAENRPRLLYISGACREILGLDPEEARADPNQLTGMVVAEDVPALVESAKRARDRVEVWEHEYRIRNAAGRTRHVRAIARPTPFEDGSMHWTGVIIDTTTLHHLQAAEQRDFRVRASVIDTLPANIALLDSRGTVRSVNARWRQFGQCHGYVGSGCGIGMDYLEVCRKAAGPGAEAALRVADGIERVLKGELAYFTDEYACSTPEKELWFRVYAAPVGPLGDEGVAVMHTDVTEHKSAVRESEHLASIVRYSDAAIISVDLDGMILSWNPGARSIFGYEEAEVLGRSITILHPENLPDEREVVLGSVRRGVSVNNRETLRLRKDGALVDVSLTVSPIINSQGDVTSISSLIFDITDQQRVRAERAELENRLRHSQRLESLGVLAGGIAHDFNNLLYVIHGNVELAMRDLPESGQARHNLEAVLAATRRASSMTSQILAFSRSSKRNEESVDMVTMLNEAVEVLRSTCGSDVRVQVHDDGEPHAVLGDSAQVYQLLINLLANASESIGGSVGTIEIQIGSVDAKSQMATEELAPGLYTRVTIADSGRGIPPGVINRIFEPFFTTRRGDGGTGMGLSVAHGIVKSHEGAIAVDSVEGKGTTFTVYLPEMPPAEKTLRARLPRAELARGSERILFVDDEAPLVRMTGEMLNALGYLWDGFTSGVSALEYFRRDPGRFQLVITDQIMPDMSGDALADQLRRIRSDIPIVLSSGYSESMNAATLARLNADAYLNKPVSMQVLAATLRELLDRESHTTNV